MQQSPEATARGLCSHNLLTPGSQKGQQVLGFGSSPKSPIRAFPRIKGAQSGANIIGSLIKGPQTKTCNFQKLPCDHIAQIHPKLLVARDAHGQDEGAANTRSCYQAKQPHMLRNGSTATPALGAPDLCRGHAEQQQNKQLLRLPSAGYTPNPPHPFFRNLPRLRALGRPCGPAASAGRKKRTQPVQNFLEDDLRGELPAKCISEGRMSCQCVNKTCVYMCVHICIYICVCT